MKYIRYIIGNKYLLTGTAFAVWMLFFDRNDIPLQISRMSELSSLKRSEVALKEKIADTREELKLLKTNPETIERYARERFLMKRDNEDVFIVKIDSSLVK